MQNAELYRRGIVLPLNHNAEECLRANNVNASIHVRFLPISDDELFRVLCQLNLFNKINARCGTLVDDFEEEWIDASNTKKLLELVDSFAVVSHNPNIINFLADLKLLAGQADALSRPLLFVL